MAIGAERRHSSIQNIRAGWVGVCEDRVVINRVVGPHNAQILLLSRLIGGGYAAPIHESRFVSQVSLFGSSAPRLSH
jgi:hypothetical protein